MPPSTTVTVSRLVPAEASWVLAAWTQVDLLSRWWWPQLPGTSYDLDPRPGGHYRIEGPAIGVTVTGTYTEVGPQGLAFTWVWDDTQDEVVEDTVLVTFESLQGGAEATGSGVGTQVTVAHTSSAHEPDGAPEQGWSDVLDRLVGLAADEPGSQAGS
jgi:uncharacterized protein YndB with AHSA1/START domain